MGQVKVEVREITPELAEQWLGRNDHNRSLKDKAIDKYASDMAAGLWDLNGETFKFNGNGRLLDGQNRLHAVMRSGATIRAIVVSGLDGESQETVDIGVPRKLSDVLKLRGETNTIDLSSAISGLWKYERDPRGISETKYPSIHAALALLERHPGLRESVLAAERIRKSIGLRSGVGAPLHYITMSIDGDDAEFFWDRLNTGVDLTAGHPILALRSVVLADRPQHGQKMPARRLWALTVKAWNAYREGRNVTLLVWRPGGSRPESFPVPE